MNKTKDYVESIRYILIRLVNSQGGEKYDYDKKSCLRRYP